MHSMVNGIMKRLTVRGKENRLEKVIQMINAVSASRDFQPESDAPEDGEEGPSEPFYEEFDEADAVNDETTVYIEINE